MAEESNKNEEPMVEAPAQEPTEVGAQEQEAPPMDVYSIIDFSISLLASYAWQSLGLMPNPQTGSVGQDLEQARVAVDCVTLLSQQLESHLPEERKREIRVLVQNLKINYVKQLDQSKEGSASR